MTTALVTGGNKGIGLAIVRQLAARGTVVYLGSRDFDRGRAAAADIDGDVRPLRLDVTSAADIAGAVAAVGSLDVLVNNAGVHSADDDMRFVYATNVFAVVDMIDAFLPLLRRSRAGRIVNVSSMRGSLGEEGAWVGQPSMSYSSSKTALNAITVHYARSLKDSGIKVNGAAPGHVATDFNGFRGTRTPDEGAAVAVRLATLGPDGPTGVVIQDDRVLAW
ncbi:short-chain dehydrogenase [Rhodococcoides trifolii]|uniref:Short-chain dehydrogenase n=1 Tax=Rhodococcoides trifolii TaxID=908250 RepID=A0A917CS65_9NOCA|nr:SDR family NAD(P)-dependent oxidoreductase [Rhodococcus trifolii]GGF97087.1 short-chain dehydrogenase [Rhodococcus trifolii]